MKESKRLDIWLVDLRLCESRSKATRWIKEGKVQVNGDVKEKPSQVFEDLSLSEIAIQVENDFVGRGALKLEEAYKKFELDFHHKTVADIGASTGGFTDFALKKGALKVFAIDVGRDQLHEKLKSDGRVINKENVNIRYGLDLGEKVDMVVGDLSFISLKLVLDPIIELIKDQGEGVLLIKPQFEVGRGLLGKKGIVKDKETLQNCLFDLYDFFNQRVSIRSVCESPIKGGDGNQEFLIHFDRSTSESMKRDKMRIIE